MEEVKNSVTACPTVKLPLFLEKFGPKDEQNHQPKVDREPEANMGTGQATVYLPLKSLHGVEDVHTPMPQMVTTSTRVNSSSCSSPYMGTVKYCGSPYSPFLFFSYQSSRVAIGSPIGMSPPAGTLSDFGALSYRAMGQRTPQAIDTTQSRAPGLPNTFLYPGNLTPSPNNGQQRISVVDQTKLN